MISVMKPWPDTITESVVDGEGLRLVVFLAGCPHKCNGCHNPETWDINNGLWIKEKELAKEILKRYEPALHSGITFSGGDPVFQCESLKKVIYLLRKSYKVINIWCYTGYLVQNIDPELFSLIDVYVDGPFIESLKTDSIPYIGSSNQRIIYTKRKL